MPVQLHYANRRNSPVSSFWKALNTTHLYLNTKNTPTPMSIQYVSSYFCLKCIRLGAAQLIVHNPIEHFELGLCVCIIQQCDREPSMLCPLNYQTISSAFHYKHSIYSQPNVEQDCSTSADTKCDLQDFNSTSPPEGVYRQTAYTE